MDEAALFQGLQQRRSGSLSPADKAAGIFSRIINVGGDAAENRFAGASVGRLFTDAPVLRW